MPQSLEAEVIAELSTLNRMDFPDDDLIGCVRDKDKGAYIDVYGRPVGVGSARRVIASVDRAAPEEPPVYHGTRSQAAARAFSAARVAKDRGLSNTEWEAIP